MTFDFWGISSTNQSGRAPWDTPTKVLSRHNTITAVAMAAVPGLNLFNCVSSKNLKGKINEVNIYYDDDNNNNNDTATATTTTTTSTTTNNNNNNTN